MKNKLSKTVFDFLWCQSVDDCRFSLNPSITDVKFKFPINSMDLEYPASDTKRVSWGSRRSVAMYTNPFARTHCTIRQVIDKFLHIDNKHKWSKDGLRRTYSNSSSKSSSSTSSNIWKDGLSSSSSKVGKRFWVQEPAYLMWENCAKSWKKENLMWNLWVEDNSETKMKKENLDNTSV